MTEVKIKYPATKVVHWHDGPVNACDEHCSQLVGLANFMGTLHVVVTKAVDGAECSNCINEAQ